MLRSCGPVLLPAKHEGAGLQGWEVVDVIEGMRVGSLERAVTPYRNRYWRVTGVISSNAVRGQVLLPRYGWGRCRLRRVALTVTSGLISQKADRSFVAELPLGASCHADDLQSFIGMVGIEQDARPAAVGSDVQAVVFGDGSDLAQGAGPRLRSTAGEIACPTWPANHCRLPVTPAPVRSLVFCLA